MKEIRIELGIIRTYVNNFGCFAGEIDDDVIRLYVKKMERRIKKHHWDIYRETYDLIMDCDVSTFDLISQLSCWILEEQYNHENTQSFLDFLGIEI